GTTFSVELYTLAPDGQRFIVGKIDRVTALTDEEAEAAKKYFQKSGWLKLMAQQVEAVAGNSQILDVGTEGLGMFNVRFKTEDVTIYDPFRPVAENDRVRRLTRYRLVSMDDEPADDEEPLSEQREISRRGTQSLKSTAPIIRRSSEAKAFDPVHNHLQNKIFELLRQRFGVDKVLMEDNFVDIKVIKPGKVVYLEIKTDPTPRKAIRQALGQLMDYAFFASPTRELVQLIVVAPGELRPTDENYVQRLTQEFKIPISYRQFTLESREFDIDS
ncbi:MAG: hypothetical protein P4M08_05470, partial [Oligoflexia bacterium]|nr:hypothetical protein [Oligoflexia bacterium]